MKVPSFRTQAAHVSGVAGQPSSFKIPGGALSQAAVAAGKGYQQLSQDAAKWGTVLYQMHRDAEISAAVARGKSSIDDTFIQSQHRPVNDTTVGDPLGGAPYTTRGSRTFYNQGTTQAIQEATTGVWDPLTRAQIKGKLGTYAADQKRVLDRYNTGRLVNLRQAQIRDGEEQGINTLASMLPAGWKGDTDFLPAAFLNQRDAMDAELDSGVGMGVIKATEAQKLVRERNAKIALYAVRKHNTAAQTSAQVQQLRQTLEDPRNFKDLEPLARAAMQEKLTNKYNRLLNAELRAGDRKRIIARQVTKQVQKTNAMSLYQRFHDAVKKDDMSLAPTMEEVNRAVESRPEKSGLTVADYNALHALIDQKGVSKSNEQFLEQIYSDVIEIAGDGDNSPKEISDKVREVQKRAAKQIGREHLSRLSIEDHLRFLSWSETMANRKANVNEITTYLSIVKKNAADADPSTGRLRNRAEALYVTEAVGTYFRLLAEGQTPQTAAENALRRVGVDPESGRRLMKPLQPLYPIDIPDSFTNTNPANKKPYEYSLPRDTTQWKEDDVVKAREYILQHKGELSKDGYIRAHNDINRIEEYLANLKQRRQAGNKGK